MISPRVSVVITAYNAEKFIHETIESVLAQTYQDFECLVIDDGSTDRTAAIVESFSDPRIRLIRLAINKGVSHAANTGIQEAKGVYIARIDSDDLMVPERLETQVAFLDAHPEVGVCGTWFELFSDAKRTIKRYATSNNAIRAWMLFINPIAQPSVCLRADVIKQEIGPYDPTIPSAEDLDLWMRLLPKTSFANLPHVLTRYRRHANSITQSRRELTLQYTAHARKRLFETFGLKLSDAEQAFHEQRTPEPGQTLIAFLDKKRNWLIVLGHTVVKTRFVPMWRYLIVATLYFCFLAKENILTSCRALFSSALH